MKNVKGILLGMLCSHFCLAQTQIDLRKQLQQIVSPFNAIVGVAINHIETGDTLTLNNTIKFPMQSVYKFPLAIAVLHKVDEGKLTLNQKVHITEKELMPYTWSPLKKKFPTGDVDISVADLLDYTVAKSDNNTCDILFSLMGGTQVIENYMHGLGYPNIAIKATEAQMHQADSIPYTNWCLPTQMSEILTDFYKGKQLSASSNKFLMQLMIETENSPQRLKGLLPEKTIVAHKTGTGNQVVNDAGIITLPNGKHIAITVFIQQSKTEFEECEKLIAQIAKVVYDYYTTPSKK